MGWYENQKARHEAAKAIPKAGFRDTLRAAQAAKAEDKAAEHATRLPEGTLFEAKTAPSGSDADPPELDAVGRTTREAIENLAHKQLTQRFGISREVKMLNEQLHPGERVLRLAKAIHNGKSGILAVSSERVLWYHAGAIGRTVIDQRHERISSVKAHKGLVDGSLVVNAGGDEWTLTGVVPKEAVDQIASMIREQAQSSAVAAPVASAGPSSTASEPNVMDQLKKLGELRDAAVLTPEEFEAKKAVLLDRL